MGRVVAALLAGILFGFGLSVSEMINPAKVLAFLDVAGAWDPSLAVVMTGALLIAIPAYGAAKGRLRPLLAENFQWPTARVIDGPLCFGAVLFGIGWGLVGFCPGPAVASFAFGLPESFAFVGSMAVGAMLARVVRPVSDQRLPASA